MPLSENSKQSIRKHMAFYACQGFYLAATKDASIGDAFERCAGHWLKTQNLKYDTEKVGYTLYFMLKQAGAHSRYDWAALANALKAEAL